MSTQRVYKFFFIGLIGIIMGGCSSIADSEIIMKTTSEKRKPKPEYMPAEEKPVANHLPAEKALPIIPQVGIRIPLGK